MIDMEPTPDETPEGGAMSDEELAAHLAEHEMRSIGYYESEIASEQADALDRYYRRPYGDEREGRSKVVDGTVAITVDNALSAILKPFVSSDETVIFEPRSKEDEEQAQQATEYVNYVLHQDNCGFLVLHDWFKDALIQKLGVVKVYWEDYTREKVERLENLDPMQIEMLAQEGVLGEVFGPDENGLYVADVRRTEPDGKLCVENVPPEEYRISPYARPGRVPPYEAHVTQKARSELVEMGFDPEVVETLSTSNDAMADSRSLSRYQDEDFGLSQAQPAGDSSRELVAVNDEYVLIDYDGDGISELRHVIRSNDTILLNEEVESGPFARLCPAPMPHKIYGLSLADQVKDEQRIATVLMRQTLDNLYLSNNPRPVLPEAAERDDGSTIDDLLSDAPGAVIRTGNDVVTAFAVPFVADKSFPMLDYIANQAEARTGISKSGQGMDPETLDSAGQITATQAAIMEDGRNARAEMIARIFAETGIKQLFKLMLRNLVQHQPRARMIRLRNKWVEMDPRHWNADMDLSIAVGLGVGNRASQMAQSQATLELQERLAQSPYSSLVNKEKVFNSAKRFLNAAGIKTIDDHLVEPERDEEGNLVPEPEQPDPQMIELQAKMQIENMKAQMKAEADQAERERKLMEMYQKIQLENIKAENKRELDEAKAQFEAQLAEGRMMFEQQMALRQQAFEERLAAHDAQRKDEEVKLKANRPGGDLDK